MCKHVRTLCLSAALLEPALASAQAGCEVDAPTVSTATLDATITAVPDGYLYEYSIANPAANTGCLFGVTLDLPSRSAVSEDQASLGPKIHRFPNLSDVFTPPGMYTINELPQFSGAVGGGISWSSHFRYDPVTRTVHEAPVIRPGETIEAFRIVSPYPPGRREYVLHVSWAHPIYPHGGRADPRVRGATLGPTHPDELTIYDGGGQKPVDVNKFLRYTNPVEHRTQLRATETKFTASVLYGPTTIPSSFRATLNGIDVTSAFHPAPGQHDAANLVLNAGSNTLVLKIEGTTPSGRTASDTDRLVLLVGN